MADSDDRLVGLTGDERILQEARDRLKRGRERQGDADRRSLEDDKFANADSRNQWQWPQAIFDKRKERPCLTLNTVRIHNDLVINEALKNRASIKVRPTGGKASYEAAQVMQSIVRRIEYISKASIAYKTCYTKQVDAGMGYVFIETAFVSEKSFDQDVYIRGCTDTLGVVLDCDIRERDGSDANWGFIFEPRPREEFNRLYPKFKDKLGSASTLGEDNVWLTRDTFLKATYYRRNSKPDTFISFIFPDDGSRIEKLASEIKEECGPRILDGLMAQIESGELDGRTREVNNQRVEWFNICGDQIVDRNKWLGRYIPICRCPGRETVIEGKIDWKGMTRQLIDAQRMLNYNCSGQVEFGALQNKSPYIAPARAIEGQEQWKTINVENYGVVTYNDIDEEMTGDMAKIDRPQREMPPQTSPVYMEGAQAAERWMMMCSGQFQSKLGENDQQSAASGVAINARTTQAETATYHFVENQGDMLRYLGMQLIDLIPKIYDTERTLHILGEDGSKRWIKIDPNQTEAVKELKKEGDEAAELAFNPSVGEYDCMSDPGPNYATQRQEAWNAISIILQQNMQLAGTIGDLLFKFGDFPGADEIMERLRKEIQATKPYLFDENASPGIVQLQEQLKGQQQLNSELTQKLAEMSLELIARKEKRDIEAYKGESDRLVKTATAIEKLHGLPGTHEELMSLIHQVVRDGLSTHITEITKANAAAIGDPNSETA